MSATRERRAPRSSYTVARPVVSLLTGGTAGGSHPRIAEALRDGFERLEVPFESVHIEAPEGVEPGVKTNLVRLGTRRLRWAAPAIRNYLQLAQPTLVLATPIEVAVVTLLAGRGILVPVVPWEQTLCRLHVGDHPLRFRVLPRLEKLTYPWAPALAVTSADVGRDLEMHLGPQNTPPIAVLPNPIDAERIRHLAVPKANHKKRLRLVAVGRLASQKGFDVLLRACAISGRDLGDWELLVLGEGPLRSTLESLVRSLRLEGRVTFCGYVRNPYPVLASADIFVHPARWEGFGLVVAEALALGVPVVATLCPGGPREILGDGHFGILVEPNDSRALAESLTTLADDSERRRDLAAAGPERAREYGPEQVALRALELAQSVGRG